MTISCMYVHMHIYIGLHWRKFVEGENRERLNAIITIISFVVQYYSIVLECVLNQQEFQLGMSKI